jgi:small subunit ribosomal protein S7
MPRNKNLVKKSELNQERLSPDFKYNDLSITKFINMMMQDGKKWASEKIFYTSIEFAYKKFVESTATMDEERLKKLTIQSASSVSDFFSQIMSIVEPSIELKSMRISGSSYQVPSPVRPLRAKYLAMSWIISGARSRKGRSMIDNLTNEFSDIVHGKGSAMEKKSTMHKNVESNRAFAHFASAGR